MNDLRAKDIMTKDVLWISEDMSVEQANKLFLEERISGAPVVASDGTMTGVVSVKDFLRNGNKTTQLIAEGEDAEPLVYRESWELPLTEEEVEAFHTEIARDLTVKEIMTPIVFNADVGTPVEELAETMLRGRIHRVFILENNELVGVVTTLDMLKVIVHR